MQVCMRWGRWTEEEEGEIVMGRKEGEGTETGREGGEGIEMGREGGKGDGDGEGRRERGW